MRASNQLINKLKTYESLRLYAYRDAVGKPTIGWGHTHNVAMGQAITLKQAEAFLHEDLAVAESFVNRLNVCKTQGQFDALVDFAYNLGCSSLSSSTLLKYIRENKSYDEIRAEFLKWNHAHGRVLDGLTERRKWEAHRYAE